MSKSKSAGNRPPVMCEAVEKRTLFSWGLSFSAELGVFGVEVGAGQGGVNYALEAASAQYGYEVGWDGSRTSCLGVDADAGGGVAVNASRSVCYSSDGSVFSQTTIGGGAGVDVPGLGGFSLTVNKTFEEPVNTGWSWWPW